MSQAFQFPSNANILSACTRGEVLTAYQQLQVLQNKPQRLQRLQQKLHNRFFREPPLIRLSLPEHDLKRMVKAYCLYFVDVLTQKQTPEVAERRLFEALSAELKQAFADFDALEAAVAQRFEDSGYSFLGGYTLPYRGPYIWKTTEEQCYDVALPQGQQALKVYFMSGFVLLSWLDFATIGTLSTGGWAKPEGLYCVQDVYAHRMNSPVFKVSYLKHEAQHFSDYQSFPQLQQKDLEYRAKLVELIYYPDATRLQSFIQEAAPGAPHTEASLALVQALEQKCGPQTCWPTLPYADIQQASREILEMHSARLHQAGAKTVTGVLP